MNLQTRFQTNPIVRRTSRFATSIRIGQWLLVVSIFVITHSSHGFAQDTDINEFAKTQAKNLSIAFQNASSKAMKSVVTVLAKRADVDSTLDELDLLDTNSARNFNIGSGVIINESGLCVTNNHVIKDSKGIRVRLGDGRELPHNSNSNQPTQQQQPK